MPAWECYACTWLNDECNVDCLMCQTKRARNLSPNAGKNNEESSVCREADSVSNNAVIEEKPLRQHNYKDEDNDSREEPAIEVRQHNVSQHPISMPNSVSNKRTEGIKLENNESNSKWDAFASLENNYESSDSEEDESDSDDDNGSEHYDGDDKEYYNQQYDDGKVSAEQQSQWNAFESLEANLGDDSSTSGSSSSSSGEESDCILIDDQDEDKKMASAATSTKSNLKTDTTECVDLVDTDDEEDMIQEKNSKPKRIKSRKRKRVTNSSAITLMDGDSDSSYLSEVESSRFQTSPATRQGIRSLPPWQRAARSKSKSPSILENDSVLPRESFSLLSNRNDVNGSGLNETRTSAPPAARQRKTSTKSSTSKKTGSRRRKRSNSDGAAPAKKKRRTRKYRRSSKRGGRGGRGRAAAASSSNRNNNPWGARERGIRQPIRDNNGSGSYMNITKQEPMLRNVGGASMQF